MSVFGMRVISCAVSLLILSCSHLVAQYLPASSDAVFYVAHVADGGPQSDKFTTTFRIVNPTALINLAVAAGTLWFFDPQGSPLPLDFGNGAVSSLQVSIPAQGSIQLKTTGASSILRTGSVVGAFDSPVMAVAEFQDSRNGVFLNGASVNAAGATYRFQTYADRYTGIAVANPTTFTIYCSGTLLGATGNNLGMHSIVLPPRGQATFGIGNVFGLASSSSSSYGLSCKWQTNDPWLAPFVALAIAGNSLGITSSMPPGGYALPSNPAGMIWNAFYQLVKTFNSIPSLQVGQPQLQILSNPTVNAFYSQAAHTVGIELALVELLADSPSEVASVIAHELGHAHQKVIGGSHWNQNIELDADQFSLLGLLLTGYDAYAAGGALGKLFMISGRTGILDQNFDNAFDVHKSFPTRIGNTMDLIQALCVLPEFASLCTSEHNLFHPHMPGAPITPLIKETPPQ